MNTSLCLPLALVLSVFLADANGQADQITALQRYSTIFKEYSRVSGDLRGAKTDLERKAAVERASAFSSKFIELAAKHPDDPVALTALRQAVQIVVSTDSAAQTVWEINESEFPVGSMDGSAGKTVDLVLRDHMRSGKLGPVIDRMRYGYQLEYEKCLRIILEKNPHHEIQGLACLALAQFLRDKLRVLRLVEDRPELAECYGIVFGEDYIPELQRLGRAGLAKRSERLFERAANEYANVKFRRGSVGEAAKAELYDIRHLSIGKIAPDIVGKDQEGVKFKLSDYRGNVVLLYFWSEY